LIPTGVPTRDDGGHREAFRRATPWGTALSSDPESTSASSSRGYPLPPREEERLAALRGYEVLDGPSSEGFDRLTQLSSQLFGVPIAVISLVDQDRQWFLSRTGLNACQTDREVAFCAHAICQDDVLVVEDACQDPRFRDNPLVTDAPGIRFYAGAPLITAEGHALGTLCVIDTQPRHFSGTDQRMLRQLARMVMEQLESHRRRHRQQPEQERQHLDFLRTCRREFERARRFGRPLSLLWLGLEGLPPPDSSDHAAAMAGLLQRLGDELRDHDRIAAPSDTSLAVLLIEAEGSDVEGLAERLRQLAVEALEALGLNAGVWGGVATLDPQDSSLEDLELRARALNRLARRSSPGGIRSVKSAAAEWSEQEQGLMGELATLMVQRLEQDPGSGADPQQAGMIQRQEFFTLGQREWERARRFQRPLSLVVFDLDHLRLLNERWGHRSGDTAIEAVGALIRGGLRTHDLIGKLGGDSFGVLMPETPAQGAAMIAERIREQVAGYSFQRHDMPAFVTLSGGCSTLQEGDGSFLDVFDRAEQSLELAKETGRNRIRLDGRSTRDLAHRATGEQGS
jgi:diguanylate cyclase (GGDEF)-like protein